LDVAVEQDAGELALAVDDGRAGVSTDGVAVAMKFSGVARLSLALAARKLGGSS